MIKNTENENRSQSDQVTLTITRQQLLELLELGQKPIEFTPQQEKDSGMPQPENAIDNTGLDGTEWRYEYLTEEVVAQKLKIGVKTLRKLRQEKKITHHKMGRTIRYTPEDLKKFHDNTRIPSKDEDDRKGK